MLCYAILLIILSIQKCVEHFLAPLSLTPSPAPANQHLVTPFAITLRQIASKHRTHARTHTRDGRDLFVILDYVLQFDRRFKFNWMLSILEFVAYLFQHSTITQQNTMFDVWRECTMYIQPQHPSMLRRNCDDIKCSNCFLFSRQFALCVFCILLLLIRTIWSYFPFFCAAPPREVDHI